MFDVIEDNEEEDDVIGPDMGGTNVSTLRDGRDNQSSSGFRDFLDGGDHGGSRWSGSITDDPRKITLSHNLKLDPKITYHKMFITGSTGSGKSFAAGVFMEQMSRLGLQFVCFDALGAHEGISQLPNVEELTPKANEHINVGKLVDAIAADPKTSVVINLKHLTDEDAQTMVAEYCDLLFEKALGRALMTIIEECQDMVGQSKNRMHLSHGPIIKLCKKGRQYGYGVCLISQRPADVDKAALTQCSLHLVHSMYQTRDLKAIEEQISHGVDRQKNQQLLQTLVGFDRGECLVYSPAFSDDLGGEDYLITKIRDDRETEHTGRSVEVPINNSAWTDYDEEETPRIGGIELTTATTDDFGGDSDNEFEVEIEPSLSYDFGSEDAWSVDLTDGAITTVEGEQPEWMRTLFGLSMVGLTAAGLFLMLRPTQKVEEHPLGIPDDL